MNRDVLKGKWNQVKGQLKKQWGKLTDDDVAQIEGDIDTGIGRIQERYGYSKEEAQRAWNAFLARCESDLC